MLGFGNTERLNRLADSGMDRLCQASLQGALFVSIVWFVSRIFKRIPASVRCWLWWLACAKLLLGLVRMPEFSSLPLHSPSITVTLPGIRSIAIFNHASGTAPTQTGSQASTIVAPPVPQYVRQSVGSNPKPFVITRRSALPPLSMFLFALWLIGTGVGLARYAFQCRAALRIVLRSIPEAEAVLLGEAVRMGATLGLRRPPMLRRSPLASGPLVVGPLWPTVVLPADATRRFSIDELRMSLAHEIAHVRRRDLPLATVPAIVEIAFFFHPLAWVASRSWKTAVEADCDMQALRLTGAPKVEYGRMLVKLADSGHRGGYAGALGATTGFLMLKERLELMESYVATSRARIRWSLAVLVALVALCVIPWRVAAVNGLAHPSPSANAIPMLPHGRFFPRMVEYPTKGTDQSLAATGADGACSFLDSPQGYTARLKMTGERFAQLSGNRFVSLAHGPVTAPLPISLTPGGSMSGRVIFGGSGRPATGIRVGAAEERSKGDDGAGGDAVTDADGRYTIHHLGPRQYRFAPDFAETGLGRIWMAHSIRNISVPKGAHIANVNAQLIGGAILHGKVIADTGEPIANLQLGLQTDDTGNFARTDDHGNDEMRAPGGKVQVYIGTSLPRFKPVENYAPHGGYLGMNPEYKRDLTVRDGMTYQVDFKLPMEVKN